MFHLQLLGIMPTSLLQSKLSWFIASIAEQIHVIRQFDRQIGHLLLQRGDLLIAQILGKATVDLFELHRGVD